MTDYIDDEMHGGPEPTEVPPPVPVIDVSESAAPEYGGIQQFVAPVSGVGGNTGSQPAYVQLLQRRVRRHRARINIDALTGGATAVILNTSPDALTANPANPVGGYITVAPRQVIWESQRPIYAVALGGPVSIYVQDESYAEPERKHDKHEK